MTKFLELLASGLALGGVLALVVLGLVLLRKATNILNFAHGDLVTLGAYLGYWTTQDLKVPILGGYVITLALMFCVGVFIELIAHAPLHRRSEMIVVIATLAAGLGIRAMLALWFGSNLRQLNSPVGAGTFTLFGAVIARQRVLIVLVAAVIIVATLLIFRYTAAGRRIRALAADSEMAQLVGVHDRRISILVFGLSASLAGLAGLLIAPLTSLSLTFGFDLMILAFGAAVIGGFTSMAGVAAGALLVGMLQQVVGAYIFPNYADTLPYIAMFLIIALKPSGLFGGDGLRRARL